MEFLIVLALIGLFCAIVAFLVVVFVLVQVFKPKAPPADNSNIFNHLRLLWFVITRPELFAKHFEWMQKDELENFK